MVFFFHLDFSCRNENATQFIRGLCFKTLFKNQKPPLFALAEKHQRQQQPKSENRKLHIFRNALIAIIIRININRISMDLVCNRIIYGQCSCNQKLAITLRENVLKWPFICIEKQILVATKHHVRDTFCSGQWPMLIGQFHFVCTT